MDDSRDESGGICAGPQLLRRRLLKGTLAGAASGVLTAANSSYGAEGAGPIVATAGGRVRGLKQGPVTSFLGLEYGAPTGGTRRFLPAQPPPPRSGVRDAFSLGPQCPQTPLDFPAWVDPSPAGENCLALNVFTPAQDFYRERLPVMVWIHGGAYVFGSAYSKLYDCASLARSGNVVVVGINHRLNLFGYTQLADRGDERFWASGNTGQLDLVAALQWIRTNIAEFGGNPRNVTLFGESGGGGKITALMAMPSARGLFNKAIIQSGSILRLRTRDEASAQTDRLFHALGLKNGDIEKLQAAPVDKLLAFAQQALNDQSAPVHPILSIGPVADGTVIPIDAWQTKAPDTARDIPTIIGTTRHESVGFFSTPAHSPVKDDADLIERIQQGVVLGRFSGAQVDAVLHAYRKALPAYSSQELMVRVATDLGFWRNALRQADMVHALGSSSVYMYECAWTLPCHQGVWAPHGVDIPLIFNVESYGVAWDGNDSDAQRRAADPRARWKGVSRQMIAAWTQFARTGDPSTRQLKWPAFDAAERSTMVFGRKSSVILDPRGGVRGAIESA